MSTEASPRMILRSCMVFFVAISLGILVFFLVALVVNQLNGNVNYMAMQGVMLWVLAGFSMLMLIAARSQFARSILEIRNALNPVSLKLRRYREAFIRYMALCDAPVIFGIIGYMLTANFTFLIFSAVLFGFMLIMFPTRKRVVDQLGLDWQEQQELELN